MAENPNDTCNFCGRRRSDVPFLISGINDVFVGDILNLTNTDDFVCSIYQ